MINTTHNEKMTDVSFTFSRVEDLEEYSNNTMISRHDQELEKENPINEVFRDPDLRNIIFNYQKQIVSLKDVYDNLVEKTKKNNTIYKSIEDLKVGDRFFEDERLFEVVRQTNCYNLVKPVKVISHQKITNPLGHVTYDKLFFNEYYYHKYDENSELWNDKLAVRVKKTRFFNCIIDKKIPLWTSICIYNMR